VCFSIFLKVRGFHSAGRLPPDSAEENFPTSRTAPDWARALDTQGRKRSKKMKGADGKKKYRFTIPSESIITVFS